MAKTKAAAKPAATKTADAKTKGKAAKAKPAPEKVDKRAAVIEKIDHPLASYYAATIDDINKKLRISTGDARELAPISTGMLCVDYVMNGGLHVGFGQVSGAEQSGKSTLSMTALAGAIRREVPLTIYVDGEGSIVPEYADNVFSTFDLTGVFASGRARYVQTTVLEEFTSMLANLTKRMPDKLWIDDANSWCYVLPKGTQETTKMLKLLEERGLKPDRKASGDSGNWFVPTTYDGPEAAVFLDSWPSLIPDKVEEDEGGAGLGATARVLAQELPRFAGKLKRKGIALWSVNQIREKPMVRYGCFHKDTPVLLADGSTMRISRIVNGRLPVEVMSYNPKKGTFEPRKVVDWYNNGRAEKGEFLQLVTDRAYKGRSTSSLRVTVSHKIQTPRGMVQAGNLRVGDEVVHLSTKNVFGEDVRQLLMGSIFGDGEFRPSANGFSISWAHTAKYKGLVKWKLSLMGNLKNRLWHNASNNFDLGDTKQIVNDEIASAVEQLMSRKSGKQYSGCATDLLPLMGVKAFAVWYMDDGTFSHDSNNGWKCRIDCGRFTDEERDAIVQRMSEVFTGVEFTQNSGRYIVVPRKDNILRFHAMLAPYMHPSMHYKLHETARPATKTLYRWQPYDGKTIAKPVTSRVVEINPWHGRDAYKFDLQVEGNHTYVVGQHGLVVHNSPEYEPGGNALKFYTSMRNRMHTRAVPTGFKRDPNDGSLCVEPSLDGKGTDVYSFKSFRNVKSKVGRPFLKTMTRVWIADGSGKPRGFDPVFDTLHHLRTTGQAEGSLAKGFKINLRVEGGTRKPKDDLAKLCGSVLPYDDFKALVLAEHFKDKTLLAPMAKKYKLQGQPGLRNWLFSQMRTDKSLWSTSEIDTDGEDLS